MTYITKEEALVAFSRAAPDHIATEGIAWTLDALERMDFIAFGDTAMREPTTLGTVVSASTRTDAHRQFWTRFTNRERVHSTQCWINDRGIPASWADLVNPRPTHREP
jgi:hypothetical protein